jgi:catechol 2,3-dioxygenase-like lactoylglutathione lyase family enzyme
MTAELDHIAVVAPDLDAGVAWVRETLGVDMPAGGRHPEMGTHNRLVGLGPDVYLEVIAVDPEAPRPPHRRWFGLDDRDAVERHWREGRRLRGYAARCTDIAAVIGAEAETFGVPMRVSRGDRNWLFAVRPDGALPLGGAAPCLIDWGVRGTPAPGMPDLGLRWRGLLVETPAADALDAALNAIGMAPGPDIRPGPEVRLTAIIGTPQGERVLT